MTGGSGEGAAPLRCPSCSSLYEPPQAFCPACEMPLVLDSERAEEPAADERHDFLRRVHPQYTRGELVRVAFAHNQAEAELIQGLLLEEGIPSMLRRTQGFDVPDMLAAGPRDVFAPESARERVDELLGPRDPGAQDRLRTTKLSFLLWFSLASIAALVIVYALYELTT